jgi:hypothetical protein
MKSWLKWSLVTVATAGAAVSIRMAQTAFDTPAIAPAVVTVRPGVAPEVTRVTYFSSDVRCTTCVRIERLTREVVERNFAPELRSGRIAFQVVNLDGPGNAHFVQDYRLISKTVIVSDLARGEEIRWENLQQVWTKHRDEQAFEAYVVDAVRRHLDVTT